MSGSSPISPEKQRELKEHMAELGIKEGDLEETFIRGSGRGGQKINTTSNCVRLKHLPTGIEVRSQASRSREANRFFARRLLCRRLDARAGIPSAADKEREKIRKQKQRRARRSRRP